MANWGEIRTNVGHAASEAAKKTEEIAQTASMHVKLARLMSKRDEQFEKLGKLTYKQLKTEESYAEQIAAIISQIDTLSSQIVKQKAKIEQAKAQKAAEKAAKAEQKQAKAKEDATAEEQKNESCVHSIKEMIDENISD